MGKLVVVASKVKPTLLFGLFDPLYGLTLAGSSFLVRVSSDAKREVHKLAGRGENREKLGSSFPSDMRYVFRRRVSKVNATLASACAALAAGCCSWLLLLRMLSLLANRGCM